MSLIIFWIVYWNYVRPMRLSQRLHRHQVAREILIAQQLAIQQQQQQQFHHNYPPVQAFDYSSVYSSPVNSEMDLPPSYEKSVENQNSHQAPSQEPKF